MTYEQLVEAKILGAIDALLAKAAQYRYPRPVPPEYKEMRNKASVLMARLASEAEYEDWSDMYAEILERQWPVLTDIWVNDILRAVLGRMF